MAMLEELKELGVNTEEAIARMAGNAKLYERMLAKFAVMAKGSAVGAMLEQNENQGALEEAHALKGVAGNLSITPLYEGYSSVVSLLRENKPGEAAEALARMLPMQGEIVNCIEKYTA